MKITTFFLTIALLVPNVAGANYQDFQQQIVATEIALEARIGVAILDSQSQRLWHYKGNERFPLNSTFKVFACAALLKQVHLKQNSLEKSELIIADNLVTYSPLTEHHVGSNISLATLCEAAITLSDNTAANLVLKNIDGPQGMTRYMRSIGDDTTQLNRWEPELNEGTPNDPRDTSTPNAVVKSLEKVLVGTGLDSASQQQLASWMHGNQTGKNLIRAKLPKGWLLADKTGAGGNGSRNIIAMITPKNHPPIFVSIYLTQTEASFKCRDQAISELAEQIIHIIEKNYL